MRRDPPDQVDLGVAEAVGGVLAVQAQHPPAGVAGDEGGAQLVAEAERAHHLPVAGAAGPLAASGPVERADRVGRLGQRDELVDVGAAVLVLQEQGRRGPQRVVRDGRGE